MGVGVFFAFFSFGGWGGTKAVAASARKSSSPSGGIATYPVRAIRRAKLAVIVN
jgi:hypothetical protein